MLDMATRNDTTRVMIVDDHPLVRSGIRALIQLEDDLNVCAEAEDQATALELIAAEQPDLVLVDISLKNSNGLNLLRDIAQNYPQVMTLAVSMHDEYTYAFRCLKAGAKGWHRRSRRAPRRSSRPSAACWPARPTSARR